MSENLIQKIKIKDIEYDLGTTIDNVSGLQDVLNSKSDTDHIHSAADVGALPADTVIPTVPTNVSAFTNDAGYLTEHQSLDGLATEDYVDTKVASIEIFTDIDDDGVLFFDINRLADASEVLI